MSGDVYVVDEQTVKEKCLNCGSVDSVFDEFIGFYQCNVCQHAWAFDEDDPDYAEAEETACPFCGGSGMTGSPYGMSECGYCNGSGFSRG